jgi:hypothetical protein
MTIEINFMFILLLLVVLKLTGVITISWLALILTTIVFPFALFLGFVLIASIVMLAIAIYRTIVGDK